MSEKPDVKKSLEAILGYELSEDEMQRIQLILRVASYTRSDLPGQGFTTKSHILIPVKSCDPAILLDVSGNARTGSDGKRLFRLTDFICEDVTFLHPVNVVATPLSSEPCFLTVSRNVVNNGKDVEIQVSTWDANGAVEPNVLFDWRCRVELLHILL